MPKKPKSLHCIVRYVAVHVKFVCKSSRNNQVPHYTGLHKQFANLRHFMIRIFPLFILLVASCSNASESRQQVQVNDPIFRKGWIQLQRGNNEAALRCFEKIIQLNPKQCAEAHLECGEIYLGHRKDPISAIYHYKAYLTQAPDGRQSPLVRQRIATAEKVYLSQIPSLHHATGGDHSDLLHSLKLLQDENSRLRRQLVALQVGANSKCVTNSEKPPDENLQPSMLKDLPRMHHYTVIKGDTLSAISQKVYGTPGRWKDIYSANRQTLPSPSQLTIGQKLNIPK
ncbi:MAG: LysM peptidoglycan-binding domain-containing protein [Puniceicoccales bacterium]|jgi:LysM repeat protein|nr:LysM peptidoglycan-binding domain-containing protein [Puniceicoccales bacterium]